MYLITQFFYSAAFESRLAVAIVRVAGGLDYGMMCEGESNTLAGSLTATSSGSAELRVRRGAGANIMHADSDLDIRTPDSQPSSRHNLSSKILL